MSMGDPHPNYWACGVTSPFAASFHTIKRAPVDLSREHWQARFDAATDVETYESVREARLKELTLRIREITSDHWQFFPFWGS
jgi:hypothetical protein